MMLMVAQCDTTTATLFKGCTRCSSKKGSVRGIEESFPMDSEPSS